MRTFKDFQSQGYRSNTGSVRKMMNFHNDCEVDMLKRGSTLPKFANVSLPSSTNANFYPFFGHDRVLVNEIRENVVGGPPLFSQKMQILGKPNFVILETCVSFLSEPLQVNYILSP